MNSTLNKNNTLRMRTIPKAYDEIKKLDNNTSLTLRSLRSMCKSGEIPTIAIGSKTLINLDLLIDMLSCQSNRNINTYSC